MNPTYNLKNQKKFKSHNVKPVSIGSGYLTFPDPKIWAKLPIYLKSLNSVDEFEQNVKNWVPQDCPCRLCKNYIHHGGFILQKNWKSYTYFFKENKLQLA